MLMRAHIGQRERGHVLPGLAIIARNVDQAIVQPAHNNPRSTGDSAKAKMVQ